MAKYELKTKATEASVDKFLNNVEISKNHKRLRFLR
jgi:hypothetical protein